MIIAKGIKVGSVLSSNFLMLYKAPFMLFNPKFADSLKVRWGILYLRAGYDVTCMVNHIQALRLAPCCRQFFSCCYKAPFLLFNPKFAESLRVRWGA